MCKNHLEHNLFLARRELVIVILFKILNWKLLINISDETVFTFMNALVTAESAKPKPSSSLAKTH